MNNQIILNEYKQEIAALFDQRSNSYDQPDFHPKMSHHLVQYANIIPGQNILDIATGTGLVAIEAAQITGNSGKVIGIDISLGMLAQAKIKSDKLGLNNIEFIQGDAENLPFENKTFDLILCCSALPYIKNTDLALSQWYNFLKPSGKIGICAVAEIAFIMGIILTKVAAKYGIIVPNWSGLTGTEEKSYHLLEKHGFKNIEIMSDQLGDYITLETANLMWTGILRNPLSKQLLSLSERELAQAKLDFFQELEFLATEQGMWNDITTFYIFGTK